MPDAIYLLVSGLGALNYSNPGPVMFLRCHTFSRRKENSVKEKLLKISIGEGCLFMEMQPPPGAPPSSHVVPCVCAQVWGLEQSRSCLSSKCVGSWKNEELQRLDLVDKQLLLSVCFPHAVTQRHFQRSGCFEHYVVLFFQAYFLMLPGIFQCVF